MDNSAGKILIIIGVILTAAGILFLFRDSLPFVRHLGRLPGDITIQGKNFSFHFPVVTCVIISILVNLILFIIVRMRH